MPNQGVSVDQEIVVIRVPRCRVGQTLQILLFSAGSGVCRLRDQVVIHLQANAVVRSRLKVPLT